MSAPKRTVVVGSAFRNSTGYLTRYFTQVATLQQVLGDGYRVRVHAVEGDSTDDTRRTIRHLAGVFGIEDCTLAICNHGQPWFGSTESPVRLTHLSRVGNAILDGARDDDDAMVYVESDLMWDANVIAELLKQQVESVVDSVSPLVMAGAAFYDIWGFRGLDGQRWVPFEPYHADLDRVGDHWVGKDLIEVSSVGSCLVMAAYLPLDQRCRMTTGALVEFCGIARVAGYRFAVNPSLRISHP